MRNFAVALIQGNDLSSDQAQIDAYGIYLMHGGTADGFLDLNPWDVQIMLTSYVATQGYNRAEILKGIATIMAEMLKKG